MVQVVKFDIADFLRDPATASAYLNEILADGDQDEFLGALGDIARAYGSSNLAAAANISRDAVYKALKEGGNPTVSTLRSILGAIGLQLVVAPAASM